MAIERWQKMMILGNGNKLTQYVDKAGKFRWRLQAKGNNEIIGASSQGFVDKATMRANYNMHVRHFKDAKFLCGERI